MCRSCWPRGKWRSDATGGRVKLRSVSVAQDGQGWRGGQDRCGAGGAAKRRAISLSGEGQQAVCQHQMCPAVPKDEGSVRKVGEVACLPDLSPVARHAGAVQVAINFGRTRAAACRFGPGVPEGIERRAATLCAGPVACRKRNRLVEKEQLRIPARLHDPASAALERQHAANPRLVPPSCDPEPLIGIVQDAAIAHDLAAIGRLGHDLARGQDAVPEGQTISSLVADSVTSG